MEVKNEESNEFQTNDTNMKDGSIGKISENRFARADLEHILLCVDDDMRMEALRQRSEERRVGKECRSRW